MLQGILHSNYTYVTKTKSTDSKRRTRSTRPAGAPVFATVPSDVGGETPATITEDHGEEKHTIDNQNASQEAKDRANARK